MNQPEFYTAIGFDEPVDINELSEENRKFFFEQFSPKPVKKNDPAVNAETNVGSTNNTVSLSVDGSLDLKKDRELIQKSNFTEEEKNKIISNAKEEYRILTSGEKEDVSNLTTREEEGDFITKNILEGIEGQEDNSDFKTSEAVKDFFKPMQEGLADLGGFGYSLFTGFGDKITKLSSNKNDESIEKLDNIINDKKSTPYQIENAKNLKKRRETTRDKVKENETSSFNDKKILKDSRDIRDFNLIKKNQKQVARKNLIKQGNKNPTQEQQLKYIEKNKDDEDFKSSVENIFVDGVLKSEQKRALIEVNRDEAGAILKGENQKNLTEAAERIADSLDDKSKLNIETSGVIDSKIKLVEQSLRSLYTLKPSSQEEADLIIEKVNSLLEERKGLINAYGGVVNEQIKIGTEAEDIRDYLNTVSRNQGWLVNPVGALVGGAYDFVDGVDEFVDRITYSPWEAVGDVVKYTTDKDSWLHKSVLSMEGLEKTNFGIDTAINNMREGLAEPLSVSEIDNWSDMWQWSSYLVGSQATNTAVMLTTGGWALPLLGASSAGASFNNMQEEIDLYGAEYTPLQMYTVALGTGLAEALSERITLGQLNRIKRGLAASKKSLKQGSRDYIKNLFTEKGAKNAALGAFVYGKETFEEGFTEAVAGFSQRALERYVLGKDVDLFDGMLDEFISGAFMSGFVYKAPGLGIKMYRAFQPADSNEAIGKLQTRMDEIGKILENSPSMDGQIRKKLEDELQDSATKVQQIMARDFKNMDKMTQQEQNDLLKKEDQIYKLRELYDATVNDNSINEKDKTSILNSLNAEFKSMNNDKIKILSEVNVREEISLAQKLGKETGKTDFGDDAVGTGQAVEVVEDDAAFMEMTGSNETSVEGTELDNGQIVLNKAQMMASAMRNNGNIGTGIHEVLHKVLKSEFSSKDPAKAKKLKDQFLKVLKSENKSIHDLVIARANANYTVKYLRENPDEYITIFASVLKENNIEYSQATDSVFKKLANFVGGLFSSKLDVDPNDFKFKDGKDLYNFVQTYVKNTSEGKISDRAKQLADAGKDITTDGKLSKNASDTVQEIFETKGKDGAFEIIEQYRGMANKLANKYQNVPGFERQLLVDEILTGKRGVIDMINEYNAETNVPLAAYINKFLSSRAIEAANRVLKQEFETDVTEAKAVVATEASTEVEVETKAKPKPKLRKDLKLQDDVIDKIKNAVIKTFGTKLPSVKSPQFKKELEKQFKTELKPVIAKLMGRTDSYETFLRDNFEAIYKALPQEIINKRFRDFADPVMKDGKQVREKTAQGNAVFTKKKITKAEFIKYFLGSDVGRSTQGTRKTALAEALSQELALDATMEVIQNPGVLEKAIAISNLVDGDFTIEGVSLSIKRPKGVKFSKVELNDFNDDIADQLTLTNAFQSGPFNTVKLQQYNSQALSYKKLLKDLNVEGFDMKTAKGRKQFLDYAYTSNMITKFPKAFWRSMQGTTDDSVLDPNIRSKPESQSDTGYQILIQELDDSGNPVSVGYDVDTFDSSTLRDFAGNLPFRNVTEADAWINQIENGEYEIDGKIVPAINFANENSISPNIMAALSSTKYTNMKENKKQSFNKIKTSKFQAEQDKSIDGLKEIFLIFEQAIKDDKNAAAFVGAILASTPSNQGHFMRTSAPIRFFTTNLQAGPKGIRFVEEHSLPASSVAKYLFALAVNGTVEANFKGVKENYYQGAINEIDDKKLKGTMLNGEKFNYGSIMPLGWTINDQTWARYFNINVGNTRGGIDPAKIIWNDGKSIAEKTGVNSYGFIAKGETKITEKEAKTQNGRLSRNIPVDASISKQVEIMSNMDKTMKLARNIDTPEKGISVFDFDDTLAKTNSKILVTMPDGKKMKIDATEFARRDAELTAKGAKYDFSEFNKVIDGKKGPLADLALKRQGKFGSKDIFVLTARPQIAASAIKKFLDGIGLSLPLANITGLENGSPQAKADWVLSKTSLGYNNFYFADDAIKNVKAVKQILDQVDVKSKVQIAKFSKASNLNKQFNNIIEDATGIANYKNFSTARARTLGRGKSAGWFIPPQAEDFVGLLYPLLGKGKTGDAGMKFFKENLLDPFNKAENALTQAKISVANDFRALKKQFKTIPKTLKKEAMDGFTYGDAVRAYIWAQQGMEIPGLSKRDAVELISFIENDLELRQFAQGLQMIQKDRMYPEPDESWLAGTITTDIIGGINNVVRKEYLQEWEQNIDIMFSPENLNKLEAAYGQNYREALENIIARMKSGTNRQKSSSRVINEITDWLNNSVGAIMFFNTKSAILQTISAINFVNYGDNNILKAGLAFANQPQYWKDFNRLFNSEYLVARRNGLKINVNESEIADAVKDAKNKPKAAIAYLLKKGFLPTQIADSFAIASGGATFYRNRINTYLKQGLTQQEAESKAFEDFYAISEETQQSSRTDRISQEQASVAGRVILAFANTPQQYARRSKKDFLDLINGRGGPGAWKGQIGRIIYYQGAQNLMFNALQNALFAMLFDDEDEEPQDKSLRIANGMADSTLRGMGIYGAAASTLKNIILKYYTENQKKNPKTEDAALEMLSFSPPLDSKVTKFRSALRTLNWEKDEIAEKGFSLDNPAYLAGGQIVSAFTNIPLDRVIKKYNNLDKAFEQETETWESVALTLGWSEWEIMGPPKKKSKSKSKKRKRKF